MTKPNDVGEAATLPAATLPAATPPAATPPAAVTRAAVTRNVDDVILLTGLRVRGNHGVYGFERAEGQDFIVDARLELDLTEAAGSDDVADTVHYGELADRLAAIVSGPPVNLLETLAARLVDACLADHRVDAATVTVHKPQAPIQHAFSDVSVSLRRTNPGDGR